MNEVFVPVAGIVLTNLFLLLLSISYSELCRVMARLEKRIKWLEERNYENFGQVNHSEEVRE